MEHRFPKTERPATHFLELKKCHLPGRSLAAPKQTRTPISLIANTLSQNPSRLGRLTGSARQSTSIFSSHDEWPLKGAFLRDHPIAVANLEGRERRDSLTDGGAARNRSCPFHRRSSWAV